MPELYEDLRWVVDAFCVLTSSRICGFGVSPILLSEIESYVRMFGIPDELEVFIRLIRAMDNEYLLVSSPKKSTGESNGNNS